MPLFLQFVLALLIVAVSIRPLMRLAPRLGLTDAPGPRKVHSTPIPRVGGIAMAIGIFVPLLFTQSLGGPLTGFIVGAATLLVFGIWDDRATLGYRAKFVGQVAAVLLCMWLGDVRIDSWTFDHRVPLPPVFGEVLTFLFLVGVTNAVNLSDGLDGLAGGMALLCLCAIALLAAISGNVPVIAVALIECGAILGFLRFNTHPAQIFMGDSGSQLLGFSIGVLSILATQGDGTSVSAALPLLLLGLPILDTLSVMIQRVRAGRSPFSPDRNHLHHKLLGLGFAHAEAVVLVYLLQVVLFLVAYWLRFESDLMILGVFVALAIGTLVSLRWADATPWRAHSGRALPVFSALIARLREPVSPNASTGARIMAVCMIAYAGMAIARAGTVGLDVGVLCLALLVALLVNAARGAGAAWLDRTLTYTAVVLVVWLDQTSPHVDGQWHTVGWLLVGITGVVALARFVLARPGNFSVTSLDLLVVFVAIVVPLLPAPAQLPPAVTAGIAKSVVLLYAVELSSLGGAGRSASRLAIAVLFAAVAVRGLLA
ncbi:MAG TPA: MraY family glycosyltransferase [Steroidobacteraceae bacterium]|nr:MraY family glycosyltransferase [Steroidobacteraceae bacterium]